MEANPWRPIRSEFRLFPEAEAFYRWQDGKFLDIGRSVYARTWRQSLQSLNLNQIADILRSIGIDGKECKTLAETKAMARAIITSRDRLFDLMKLAVTFLDIPPPPIITLYLSAGVLQVIRHSRNMPHMPHTLSQ